MKDSRVRTNGGLRSAKPTQVATISERKLKANRENAKRSTGPRTLRGKAFSRRNAVKHGMFVNFATDFEALHEDPKEYQELLDGLWDQYQPVGRAEEIEVERIAVCCWRLKRAWRYENAVNLVAQRDFTRAELDGQLDYCEEKDKEGRAILDQLRIAKKEMEDTDQLSDETKQRIFAMDPVLKRWWPAMIRGLQELFEQTEMAAVVPKLNQQQRSLLPEIYTVTRVINVLEHLGERRLNNVLETAIGRHAIPDSDALDRILRYETTTERYRSRAIEQLDRLQRRRKGELVPPTMRLHLS